MTLTEFPRVARPIAVFETTFSTEDTCGVIAFHGEADLSTLPVVVAALARVVSDHDGPIVVDLADATFIDVGTVRAIGRASTFLTTHDRTLTVRRPSRIATRLLAFLGLSDLIQPEPAVAA